MPAGPARGVAKGADACGDFGAETAGDGAELGGGEVGGAPVAGAAFAGRFCGTGAVCADTVSHSDKNKKPAANARDVIDFPEPDLPAALTCAAPHPEQNVLHLAPCSAGMMLSINQLTLV